MQSGVCTCECACECAHACKYTKASGLYHPHHCQAELLLESCLFVFFVELHTNNTTGAHAALGSGRIYVPSALACFALAISFTSLSSMYLCAE